MKKVISLALVIVLCFAYVNVLSEEYLSSDWAKADCERALGYNWVEKGDFTKNITREQFCVIAEKVLNSAGIETIVFFSLPPFDDTNNSAVCNLYGVGIVKGKDKRLFAPDDLITREEAAVILSRMCDKLQIETSLMISMVYADDAEISSWSSDAVYKMTTLGVMQGTDTGFEPKGSFTIEQALITFVRIFDLCGNKHFADTLNAHMPEDENYMFSPLSVKMALLLAANGADSETQSEITRAFGIVSIEDENAKAKSMIEKYSKVDVLKFDIANSIWVNRDKTKARFNSEYEKCATEYYHAQLGEVTGKDAADKINSWVSEKTREKINSIIPEGYSDFYAAIVNALYFKGAWQNEFSKRLTKPENFTSADGTVKEIDFMTDTGYYNYCDDTTVKIIEMPYKNTFSEIDEETGIVNRESYPELDVSMYIMLADDDVNVAEKLSWATQNLMGSTFVKLSVPKFKIEFSTQLKPMLENMGIKKAFDGGFNGILKDEQLFIDNVIHKTYIAIDEEGTEAAAVTAVKMGATSSKPPEPVEFKADKPFYFVIRDNISGEILFMGRYAFAV